MRRSLLVGALLFFASVGQAHAAQLYLDPGSATLNRGDIMKVAVRLDTDKDACINAVDAVIHYSSNIDLVDTSRGSSIMSVWVQPPTIDAKKHTVTFAGGIPNGYCGRINGDPMLTNDVLDLVFQSPGFVIGSASSTKSTSTATITFDPQTTAYLNNGLGTPAPLTFGSATIALRPNAGGVIQDDWNTVVSQDKTKPEPFSIKLERTPNAFSNEYFITFNTTDKQSGIDHYEVMEEPLHDQNLFLWGRANAPWVTARSPYVLKDQSLNSTIYVKAVDKAGNNYIATLVPDKSQRTLSQRMVLGYTLLGVVAVVVLMLLGAGLYFSIRFLRRRRLRKMVVQSSGAETETIIIDSEEESSS